MDDSAIIDGKVFVFHIKSTEKKDWDGRDIAYGVAHEGNDGMTYTQFKFISEKLNKKCWLTKKANVVSDSSCRTVI